MRIGSLNLQHDALVRAYTQHYQGGSGILPAFEGSLYQDGSGIGDIFRSVFRAIFPIFSSGATTFLKGAAEGLSQGKSLGDAAKGALAPTAQDIIGNTVNRVMQKGSGRKRRKHSKKRKASHKKKRAVYKRKRKTASKKRHSKRRKLSFDPVNF